MLSLGWPALPKTYKSYTIIHDIVLISLPRIQFLPIKKGHQGTQFKIIIKSIAIDGFILPAASYAARTLNDESP